MNITRVGFIGLGEMGKPMAKNLLKHSFTVATCSHVRKQAAKEVKELGAELLSSPKEVAAVSDVIITMVRDISQTDEVIYGKGFWEGKGIWQGIRACCPVIVCSTLLPGYCRGLATTAKELMVDVLDAPVSGGYSRAESGDLTFMVGGNKDTFVKCLRVFEAMGKNVFFLEGPGMGQAMKLINNYMMIINSFGTSEAIAAGLKAGLKLQCMLDIIKESSGNSSVIQNWERLATSQWREEKKRKTSNKSIFKKDLELAVSFFDELGSNSRLGNLVLKMNESSLFPTGDADFD
jgi:3-hydroxyisobutyrate dehydrogenase